MQPFAGVAKALAIDWKIELHERQVQRWAQGFGQGLIVQRDREVFEYRQGRRPEAPPNEPELLVVGMDGGRVQIWPTDEEDSGAAEAAKGRQPPSGEAASSGQERQEGGAERQEGGAECEEGATTGRWREDKVCTVTTYVLGDGKEKKPQPLVTTCVATMRDAAAFGPMARVEAERRGIRQALQVLCLSDGGNWIGPILASLFGAVVWIIDWYHATEHLWDCGKAAFGKGTPQAAMWAERAEAWLWDGKTDQVIAALEAESQRLGSPLKEDGPDHPRRVLARNVGYFTRHQGHMKYPEYRAKGWPIGSGVTEAAVKQFNKRVKGTEQSWLVDRVEPILMLRALWISQDTRWSKHWATRPAYVN